MRRFTLEEIEAVLDEVKAHYPEEVFPPFTKNEPAVSRDRVSASVARRTVENLRRIFRQEAQEDIWQS